MDINKLAVEIHQQNKAVGWWDDPDRCLFTCLQLVSTEIAEATEGERKNLMDDHLPHRKMGEVELADALIRMLDFGGHLGLTFDETIELQHSAMFYINHSASIGMQHLGLNAMLTVISLDMHAYPDDVPDDVPESYSLFILAILLCGELNGYDIEGAMIEKLEYNKTRADHKRENRELENGKKF